MEAKIFIAVTEKYGGMGGAVIAPVPVEIADYFLQTGHTRMKCLLKNEHRFHCALNSRGEAGHYLLLSKKIRNAFDINEGEAIAVVLEADESKYGLPVPIEWEEVLLFDEPVAKIFSNLTPGRQRSVLHLVASPKREETRIKRALKIADSLLKGVSNPQDFLKNHD